MKGKRRGRHCRPFQSFGISSQAPQDSTAERHGQFCAHNELIRPRDGAGGVRKDEDVKPQSSRGRGCQQGSRTLGRVGCWGLCYLVMDRA